MTDSSGRELAFRALVAKTFSEIASTMTGSCRKYLTDVMGRGDRFTITDPDDASVVVGTVYRTSPKASAMVTDGKAFAEWMAVHYPDSVKVEQTITDHAAAVKVLLVHDPHLVATTPGVAPWAVNEVLTATVQARCPCGPGGETDVPGVAYRKPGEGVVTVRVGEDGPGVIQRLWQAGRIDMETGAVKQLPRGGDGSDD